MIKAGLRGGLEREKPNRMRDFRAENCTMVKKLPQKQPSPKNGLLKAKYYRIVDACAGVGTEVANKLAATEN